MKNGAITHLTITLELFQYQYTSIFFEEHFVKLNTFNWTFYYFYFLFYYLRLSALHYKAYSHILKVQFWIYIIDNSAKSISTVDSTLGQEFLIEIMQLN